MFSLYIGSPQQLWRCSPAASRRISSGSLLKVPAESGDRSLSQDDSTPGPRQPFRDRLRSSVERDLQVSIDLMASVSAKTAAANAGGASDSGEAGSVPKTKKLPIINPLVRLPMWPSKITVPIRICATYYFLISEFDVFILSVFCA